MDSLWNRLTLRIEEGKKQLAGGVLTIGLALNEAKEILQKGQFLAFLKQPEVNIQPRTAQLYMKIAKEEDAKELAKFGIAKATQLLRLSLHQRADLMAKEHIEAMSVQELKDRIDQILRKPKKERVQKETNQQAYELVH